MRVWVAIWVGSSVICRTAAAWIFEGVALKLIIIMVAAGFVKGLPWTTSIVYVLAVGWLLLAIVLGLRTPAEGAPQNGPVEVPADPAVPTPGELVEALHQVGAPHAHITALADYLGTPNERVREGLIAASIPVSGGVRMRGRPVAVSPGVKRDHFPPLPSPAVDGSLGGVLTSNNNSNNSGGEAPGEGMSIIKDDAHPSRWHVLRRARS